jgi:hypothetical protein
LTSGGEDVDFLFFVLDKDGNVLVQETVVVVAMAFRTMINLDPARPLLSLWSMCTCFLLLWQ